MPVGRPGANRLRAGASDIDCPERLMRSTPPKPLKLANRVPFAEKRDRRSASNVPVDESVPQSACPSNRFGAAKV
jgi:hypothetical protein